MSLLKPSGLKAPGRVNKHSSPMGRGTAAAGPKEGSPLHKQASAPTSGDRLASKSAELGDDCIGDFAIGDRIWVNGVKPGIIQFLGETQFAPGKWAGVVLDEPVGKNDGSVGGVRYFECEPLQGIFTRPSKLALHPSTDGAGSDALSGESITFPVPASHHGTATPPLSAQRINCTIPLRESILNSSMKTGNESGSNLSDSGSVKKGDKELRCGDRVLVGGTKTGVVKYVGETDFAKGEWCGVELDEPLGKNDGAVAGTRYFQCPPKFGLFAPIHKVMRIGFPSTTPAKTKKSKRMAMGVSALTQSPSSSSISSVSSVASSVGGRPSRTGLLTETSSRYARKISGTTALQEALKEKQQHIEQLLAERDLERAEVAKATSHICEVEKELAILKATHAQYVTEAEGNLQVVRSMLNNAEKQKQELLNTLEEEKRKIEDLQFRVEEESITKGDLELTTVAEKSRIAQLEDELSLRNSEIEELQQRLRNSNSTGTPEHSLSLQSEALKLREQLLSVNKEHQTENILLREKYEARLQECQQEMEKLKASNEKYSHDVSELRQKLHQATKENMEMMDNWKNKLDTLVSDHQKSLEELKVSLISGTDVQNSELVELRATIESLKMEHQLEWENLKAKHEIEMALHIKEKEDFKVKLQEAKCELEECNSNWRNKLEVTTSQHRQELQSAIDQLRNAELRLSEQEKLQLAYKDQAQDISFLKEQISVAERKMIDYEVLQKSEMKHKQECKILQEKLQAMEARHSSEAIDNNNILKEKMKMKQSIEELLDKLSKREKDVSSMSSQIELLKTQIVALEHKSKSSEIKVDATTKEKVKLEMELEALTRKSHDASGQLVLISQELLKKERNLNELRSLLLETNRHSCAGEKDLSREVHKAEWRLKEQKLQEDIKVLREKLYVLGTEKYKPDQKRRPVSLQDTEADAEISKLQQRLVNTEEALRSALEQNQQMEKLMQAMQTLDSASSANGVHQRSQLEAMTDSRCFKQEEYSRARSPQRQHDSSRAKQLLVTENRRIEKLFKEIEEMSVCASPESLQMKVSGDSPGRQSPSADRNETTEKVQH
ncbi:CAP-Gly domain-containing linker protein 2 isoform X1 [Hypanus sabinus]|uniref:CAP-Gly domain-containing linker protein 2 isoform X1 n=1 Tax=Hypanus sabinus TaxID=79690 RepID=UPI0028C488D2|nr:CAP-Gly domain-containing linker protein 2 isoform X1 [Hypanus sabinus]XP_059829042.1 CAP-Gly domain-containing linker protein 2 isoform X1 [Hypanus sabinus]